MLACVLSNRWRGSHERAHEVADFMPEWSKPKRQRTAEEIKADMDKWLAGYRKDRSKRRA